MAYANEYYLRLPGSYLFADVAKRVNAYKVSHPKVRVISLGIGDVTRPLAPAVIEAMHKATDEMAVKATFRGYGPERGYDFLRDAIMKGDFLPHGIHLDRDEIFVNDGAKSDTGNFQELLRWDNSVAVTDPVYPVYIDSNAMIGRAGKFEDGRWTDITYLPCTAENNFTPALPDHRVDMIYLCYPNNPTGTVLRREQLQKWVDYAHENGAIIIYDAAYRAFVSTPDVPLSIYELDGAKECAIECNSFSKTAGFTGTRCGYTIVPHALKGLNARGEKVELNALWKRRMSTKFNGVSYPVQRAAAAIYTPEGQQQIRATIAYYMNNARIIREGLTAAGITVFGGVDAPYIWLKVPGNMTSWEFFDRLLDECHIVGTPGSGFGPSGEGYFRLTAFNTLEKTEQAVARIREWKI